MAQRGDENLSTTKSPTAKNDTEKFVWLRSLISHENYSRFTRFGLIDQSLLIVGFGLGFKIDKLITKRIGVVGLGPILGAALSNMIGDCAASLPEGRHAVLGILTGAMIPMLPLFGALLLRRQFNQRSIQNMAWFGGFLVVGTYGYTFYRYYQERKHSSGNDLNIQNTFNISGNAHGRTANAPSIAAPSPALIETKK
jgi:hypothetical protein